MKQVRDSLISKHMVVGYHLLGAIAAFISSRQGASFVEFHLLKGPEAEDHTLYASHTVWENRAVFEALTKSDAFRAAHSRAGDNKPLYLDHPQFEGFEVRQTVGAARRCDTHLLSSVRERSWMNSGKHVLVLSFSGFDPGCVKTWMSQGCVELFAQLPSAERGRQYI